MVLRIAEPGFRYMYYTPILAIATSPSTFAIVVASPNGEILHAAEHANAPNALGARTWDVAARYDGVRHIHVEPHDARIALQSPLRAVVSSARVRVDATPLDAATTIALYEATRPQPRSRPRSWSPFADAPSGEWHLIAKKI